jgi:hypothetical protein
LDKATEGFPLEHIFPITDSFVVLRHAGIVVAEEVSKFKDGFLLYFDNLAPGVPLCIVFVLARAEETLEHKLFLVSRT